MQENIILSKSRDFAIKIAKLSLELKKRNEYNISNQLLRSATSIGANVNEATAAMSKKEFIQKMSIASKEARESYYWLQVLQESNLVSMNLSEYLTLNNEIIRILTAIVKTAQLNNSKNR